MSEETVIMPGARLRRAREEQGLTSEEVSRQLRLSLSYLKALENDDYGRLPEPTFVKGYLRNYARLVGLPAEELARRFQQEVDEQRSAEDERRRQALEQRPQRRDWRLPLLLVLLVALLVALGWWLWPRPDASPVEPGSALPESTLREEQQAPESPKPADDPEPSWPGNPAPGASDDNLGPTPEEDIGGPATPVEDGDAPRRPGERPGDEGESALAADAPAPPTSDAANGSADRVTLSFSRVCWVRVEDATGAVLSQGQREAGDRLDLQGEAPFRLTVGDAAAVASVRLNGEAVSLPSQRSGDVVRVTLP